MNEGPRRSIAIFRALQLGDLLCAIPAIRAIRKAEPSARITLIGLPWAEDFVARFSSCLDDFLAFPGWDGVPERSFDKQRFEEFERAAAARRFDLAVQMHGDGGTSNAFVAAIPASARAGYVPSGEEPPPGFITYPGKLSEVDRMLTLAAHLGALELDPALEFPLRQEELDDAEALLASLSVDPAAPLACVHAGGRGTDRRWHVEGFAAVVDELAARGYVVALTGSEIDRPVNDEVRARAHAAVLDLTGLTSIGLLGAVIARAQLVVTNDSGPSHLAAALRVRSVVIFTGSDRERWAPADGGLHRAVGAGRPGGGPPAPPPPLEEVLAALPAGPAARLGGR